MEQVIIDFLREKGLLDSGNSEFIIIKDGTPILLNDLFLEFTQRLIPITGTNSLTWTSSPPYCSTSPQQ